MKKTYESPSIEKVAFMYRDQVVVASNSSYVCKVEYSLEGNDSTCNSHKNWLTAHE